MSVTRVARALSGRTAKQRAGLALRDPVGQPKAVEAYGGAPITNLQNQPDDSAES